MDETERGALTAVIEVAYMPAGQVVREYNGAGNALYVSSAGEVEVFIEGDTGSGACGKPTGKGSAAHPHPTGNRGARTAAQVGDAIGGTGECDE